MPYRKERETFRQELLEVGANNKRISIFFIALLFLIGLFSYRQLHDFLLGQREIDRYVYPTDFSDCLVVSQKKAKCAIPEEILSSMTVEELVWAVIDYPFLSEVGLSSQLDGGSEWIVASSDAFAKLIECRHPENRIIRVLKDALEREDTDEFQINAACQLFYVSRGKYFDFSRKQLKFLEEASYY